jgi:hypothetical protein
MFCAPRLIFGGNVGVRSRFDVLRSRTRYRRCGGHRVPFLCFALPNSFSAVPRVSGLVCMFGVPVLVFSGTDGVGSRFHVLRSRTRFRRCGGRRVPFSCFALGNSFSAVPRASGHIYMFCVPVPIFSGSEGVGSFFHVLRPRTRFRQYRGRWVPFSCFALPDSFSAFLRASGPFFMLCAARLVFDDTVGVGSRFHFLRFWTRFR